MVLLVSVWLAQNLKLLGANQSNYTHFSSVLHRTLCLFAASVQRFADEREEFESESCWRIGVKVRSSSGQLAQPTKASDACILLNLLMWHCWHKRWLSSG